MNKDLILNAASKSGFKLEFETKKIFSEKGFKTEINQSYLYKDVPFEIDIVASYQRPEIHFVVECKGSESTSCLILVKDAVSNEKMAIARSIFLNSNARLVGFNSTTRIPSSITGDFYRNTDKALIKLSKNDEENNFYKAQQQIKDGILAFYKHIEELNETPYYIVPLIVTNSQIWAVDYNWDEPQCAKYKWFLQKIKLDSRFKLSTNNTPTTSLLVPIVNIDYLKDFVTLALTLKADPGQIFPFDIEPIEE